MKINAILAWFWTNLPESVNNPFTSSKTLKNKYNYEYNKLSFSNTF